MVVPQDPPIEHTLFTFSPDHTYKRVNQIKNDPPQAPLATFALRADILLLPDPESDGTTTSLRLAAATTTAPLFR